VETDRFVFESVVAIIDDISQTLSELAPGEHHRFTVLRERLGLPCPHTRLALQAAFEKARQSERFRELLRELGYPGTAT